jgi:hypothetical protein
VERAASGGKFIAEDDGIVKDVCLSLGCHQVAGEWTWELAGAAIERLTVQKLDTSLDAIGVVSALQHQAPSPDEVMEGSGPSEYAHDSLMVLDDTECWQLTLSLVS